jgi:hypothetical protein
MSLRPKAVGYSCDRLYHPVDGVMCRGRYYLSFGGVVVLAGYVTIEDEVAVAFRLVDTINRDS